MKSQSEESSTSRTFFFLFFFLQKVSCNFQENYFVAAQCTFKFLKKEICCTIFFFLARKIKRKTRKLIFFAFNTSMKCEFSNNINECLYCIFGVKIRNNSVYFSGSLIVMVMGTSAKMNSNIA